MGIVMICVYVILNWVIILGIGKFYSKFIVMK